MPSLSGVGGNSVWGKLDSDVGREGEEGYELREVGNDGQGGWEEGGVDGSTGGGVSATAAAMEWSIGASGGGRKRKGEVSEEESVCRYLFTAPLMLVIQIERLPYNNEPFFEQITVQIKSTLEVRKTLLKVP